MNDTITLGTPHNGDITPEYLMSMLTTQSHMLINSKYNLRIDIREGCYVHQSRNIMFRRCKDDYLMFIDTDMAFPADGIEKLIKLDKDIVGGLYYNRKDAIPLAFNANAEGKYQKIESVPDAPFQCDAIATGFMLIKKKVIDKFNEEIDSKRLKALPFDFIRFEADGFELGEDMAFCRRAKELGFEIWCDPTMELVHVGKKYIDRRWYEAIKETAKDLDLNK
jgi:GT2 family glycosyltransferase